MSTPIQGVVHGLELTPEGRTIVHVDFGRVSVDLDAIPGAPVLTLGANVNGDVTLTGSTEPTPADLAPPVGEFVAQ